MGMVVEVILAAGLFIVWCVGMGVLAAWLDESTTPP